MSQEQPQICPVVELVNDRPATTSLKIAECFNKRHDSVLRDIRNLLAECPVDFGRHNFVESSYTNEQGKEQPMYTVYFDGFILLVMGYTGKKALTMKLAYIGAFNAMREKLEAKTALPQSDNPDMPIGPADQNTLQAIVRAKVAQMPEASSRGGFPQIWSRFNNHFRLGSYKQLPQSKMAEAVEYLVKLGPDNASSQKALPGGAKKWVEMPEYAAKIDRLVLETQQKSNEFMKAVSDLGYAMLFRPACLDDEVTDFGKELGHYLHGLGFAAQTTAKSMCEMAEVYRGQLGKQS